MTTNNNLHVPLRRRVWAFIRNNPGVPAETLYEEYRESPSSSVSSILSLLEYSGAAYVSFNASGQKLYYTEYCSYERVKRLMSEYRNEQGEPRKPDTKTPEITQEAQITAPVPTPLDRIEELVNTLTLTEGQQLYKRLQTIFQGVPA